MPAEWLAASERYELVAKMRRIALAFRQRHPLSNPPWTTGSYAIPTNVAGQPDIKVLAWFPSPGCMWSLSGGCTMCDFSADPNPGSPASAIAAFRAHLRTLDAGTRYLHLGPGGSFFDDREVPPELRRGVLESLRELPFLQGVGIETRPNLMSRSKLLDTLHHLPPTVRDLSVGFGLEALDDLIRDVNVFKGYGPRQVEKGIALIDWANAHQDQVRVETEMYVLLKPLFLTEQEGIDEAVRTVDWAYRRGAATVALFMNTVKRKTVQGYLAGRVDLTPPTRYEPPYYRSAVQVLRQLTPSQRVRTQVLGVQSGVPADGMPRGCPLCVSLLSGALVAHNFTRNSMIIEHAATSECPCKPRWRMELQASNDSMKTRIQHGLDVLDAAFAR